MIRVTAHEYAEDLCHGQGQSLCLCHEVGNGAEGLTRGGIPEVGVAGILPQRFRPDLVGDPADLIEPVR